MRRALNFYEQDYISYLLVHVHVVSFYMKRGLRRALNFHEQDYIRYLLTSL